MLLLQLSGGDLAAPTPWELPSFIISIIALVAAAAVAIWQALLTQKQSQLAEKLSGKDRLLTQRQMFVTIWPYISELSEVNPAQPVEVDVIKGANALELVAISWEADVIDHDLIRRAFADNFIAMYDAIDQVGKLPRRGVTGRQLLASSPATGHVYQTLKTEKGAGRAVPALNS